MGTGRKRKKNPAGNRTGIKGKRSRPRKTTPKSVRPVSAAKRPAGETPEVVPTPDYEEWFDLDAWRLCDACVLAIGVDPAFAEVSIQRGIIHRTRVRRRAAGYARIYKMAVVAIRARKLPIIEPYGEDDELDVEPENFIRWVCRKRLALPDGLVAAARERGYIPVDEGTSPPPAVENMEWSASREGQPATPTIGQDCVFQREADAKTWLIVYKGVELPRMNDAKGLHYISHLLSRPQQDVLLHDLFRMVNPAPEHQVPAVVEPQKRSLPTKRPSHGTGADDRRLARELLLEVESGNLTGIPAELQPQLNELDVLDSRASASDPAEAERIRNVRKMIILRAIQIWHRKGGQGITEAAERMRKSVTNAIGRSIKAIRKENRELATHLRGAIKGGASFRYYPPEAVPWKIDV